MHPTLRTALSATITLMMITPAFSASFTAKDLAAEEGKFAAYSVKNGMRAAFIEFFAAESWLLRPEPVDAQAWLRTRPEPAIVLDWKSQLTILSASGDLGFSSGPSIVRDNNAPNEPAAHGQFFSIWQKQKTGEWKVLVDHGISHGPPAVPDRLSDAPLIAIDLPPPLSASNTPNDDPERQFIARNRSGAYADVVTPRTRLLRANEFPIDGVHAIGNYFKYREWEWTWSVKLQGTSLARDFAYAVGNATWQAADGVKRKGQYVRVWVRENVNATPSRWTLAADVVTPEPAAKK